MRSPQIAVCLTVVALAGCPSSPSSEGEGEGATDACGGCPAGETCLAEFSTETDAACPARCVAPRGLAEACSRVGEDAPCDINFNVACASGLDCVVADFGTISNGLCLVEGSVPEGKACFGDEDCAPGLLCVGEVSGVSCGCTHDAPCDQATCQSGLLGTAGDACGCVDGARFGGCADGLACLPDDPNQAGACEGEGEGGAGGEGEGAGDPCDSCAPTQACERAAGFTGGGGCVANSCIAAPGFGDVCDSEPEDSTCSDGAFTIDCPVGTCVTGSDGGGTGVIGFCIAPAQSPVGGGCFQNADCVPGASCAGLECFAGEGEGEGEGEGGQ